MTMGVKIYCMAIINRKAKFDYEILEKYEAGIVLNGDEVKAIRGGKVNISQSFAKFVEGELYLVNGVIADSSRSRKLLMHKNELNKIAQEIKAKKLTLVPLKLYNKGRIFKIELGLARHKKAYQKREKIKATDIEREMARELKEY